MIRSTPDVTEERVPGQGSNLFKITQPVTEPSPFSSLAHYPSIVSEGHRLRKDHEAFNIIGLRFANPKFILAPLGYIPGWNIYVPAGP